jgi:glycosyltransferase involved in cell wall biosynthesis
MTLVLTHFPSPYQVELFNEVERQQPGSLKVLYLFESAEGRSWTGTVLAHTHAYLDDEQAMQAGAREAERADVVVFNYYNDARAAELIRIRSGTGRPWCFWGERPGYRFPLLARVARMGRLAPLYDGVQPIWGIGQWAVEAYRHEFGSSRPYVNLPYYSNLERFQGTRPVFSAEHFTFLFSGALTHRKGVELLARAFLRLAAESPGVRLRIMGEGEGGAALKRLVGAHPRVEWVGFKDWRELPQVYASAHVLCVPSRHDGWGLVVPEGLASGLPTIATSRTGAALDLITTGANGWLIDAGDEQALYDAMRSAASLTEPEWRVMSERARASVAHHTLANGARRFLNAVDAALGCEVKR